MKAVWVGLVGLLWAVTAQAQDIEALLRGSAWTLRDAEGAKVARLQFESGNRVHDARSGRTGRYDLLSGRRILIDMGKHVLLAGYNQEENKLVLRGVFASKPEEGVWVLEQEGQRSTKAQLDARSAAVKPVTREEIHAAIAENLQKLDYAARRYFAENSTNEATYDDLVGPGRYIPKIEPVAGEDYTNLVFTTSGGDHTVKTNNGLIVTLRR